MILSYDWVKHHDKNILHVRKIEEKKNSYSICHTKTLISFLGISPPKTFSIFVFVFMFVFMFVFVFVFVFKTGTTRKFNL